MMRILNADRVKEQIIEKMPSFSTDMLWAVTISPRARRLILRIDLQHDHIIVVCPHDCHCHQLFAFLENKTRWLTKALSHIPPRVHLKDGAIIPFRGKPHRLTIDPNRMNANQPIQSGSGNNLEIRIPANYSQDFLLAWLKAEARQCLETETSVFASYLGYLSPRVVIGDTRTRWGSCSPRTIRYNWRLIFMPESIRRYIVAHEACHLRYANHGQGFYKLLAAVAEWGHTSQHHEAKHWLRSHGAGLHRIGPAKPVMIYDA